MFTHLLSTLYLQIGELVEGIFEFGFWVAIILVVVIGLIIYWLVKKFRSRT
jgi:hypothetical protein